MGYRDGQEVQGPVSDYKQLTVQQERQGVAEMSEAKAGGRGIMKGLKKERRRR